MGTFDKISVGKKRRNSNPGMMGIHPNHPAQGTSGSQVGESSGGGKNRQGKFAGIKQFVSFNRWKDQQPTSSIQTSPPALPPIQHGTFMTTELLAVVPSDKNGSHGNKSAVGSATVQAKSHQAGGHPAASRGMSTAKTGPPHESPNHPQFTGMPPGMVSFNYDQPPAPPPDRVSSSHPQPKAPPPAVTASLNYDQPPAPPHERVSFSHPQSAALPPPAATASLNYDQPPVPPHEKVSSSHPQSTAPPSERASFNYAQPAASPPKTASSNYLPTTTAPPEMVTSNHPQPTAPPPPEIASSHYSRSTAAPTEMVSSNYTQPTEQVPSPEIASHDHSQPTESPEQVSHNHSQLTPAELQSTNFLRSAQPPAELESPNTFQSTDATAKQESQQHENSAAKRTVSKNEQDQIAIPILERIVESIQTRSALIKLLEFDERLASYSYLDAEHVVGRLIELCQNRIERLASDLRVCENNLIVKESEFQQRVDSAVRFEQNRLSRQHTQAIESQQDEHQRIYQLMQTQHDNEKRQLQAQMTELSVEKSNLQAQLSELNDEMITIRDQIANVNREKGALETEVLGLNREKDALQTEVLGLKREKDAFHTEVLALNRDKNAFQSQVIGLNNEKNGLQTRLSKLNDAVSSLQKEVYRLENEKSSMERDRENELEQWGNWHKGQLRERDIEHDKHVSQLNDSHRTEIANLQARISSLREDSITMDRQYKSQLQNAEAVYKKRVIDMENRHRYDLRAREQDAAAKMSNIQNSYEQKLAMAAEKHELDVATLRSDIDHIKLVTEEDKRKLTQNFTSDLNRLKIDHDTATSELRRDNEALKGALVARVHNKSLSDHEVSSNFQKLALVVDGVSRDIQWDKMRESTWPYQESVLRRYSENVRKLKQHIIQNAIWIILYDRIFCTPFRVFAEGCKSLEPAWIEAFGQDRHSEDFSHWPKPTQGSEEWRHLTVKRCLEAVEQAENSSDFDRRQKIGYEQSLATTVREICRMLEKVSSVDGNSNATVKDLIRLAAKFWVDMGSQRCRIVVALPKLNVNVLDAGRVERSTLELVVKPEVRRIGNSQGQQLDKQEVVGGCEGEHSRFQLR